MRSFETEGGLNPFQLVERVFCVLEDGVHIHATSSHPRLQIFTHHFISTLAVSPFSSTTIAYFAFCSPGLECLLGPAWPNKTLNLVYNVRGDYIEAFLHRKGGWLWNFVLNAVRPITSSSVLTVTRSCMRVANAVQFGPPNSFCSPAPMP